MTVRSLCWFVLGLGMLTARPAAAEKCYPANLYREHWDDRDIFATMTAAERGEMPSPRDVARKWPEYRGKWYAGVKLRSGDFEEFSVLYRTEQLIEIRRDAWRARNPGRTKQLEACKERNQVAAKQADEDAERKRLARKEQMEDEHFAKLAPDVAEGERRCVNGYCRVMRDGEWVKVGKLEDQPCADDDRSTHCLIKRNRQERGERDRRSPPPKVRDRRR